MELVIANATLRGTSGVRHVGIAGGRIRRISEDPLRAERVIEAHGRLLTPGLVDAHLHLDKALTADRVRWDQEWPTTSAERRAFLNALGVQIRRGFTIDDIMERAVRLARMASAAGMTAMRAQCEVDALVGLDGIRAVLMVRETLRPYLDLQITVFPRGNLLSDEAQVSLVRGALELGADAVGGIPEVYVDCADAYLDLVFTLAREHDAGVDLHVDQLLDPEVFTLPLIVARARRFGLEGRVTAAHVRSLAVQPSERVVPLLREMRDAGVSLACLPHEFVEERIQLPRSLGVTVSLINDNVRDPWQRGNSADLVLVALIYARVGSVRSDAGLEETFDMLTTFPARSLRLPEYGLAEGAKADLVLFDGSTVPEVILHLIRPGLVFKEGQIVARNGQTTW